MSKYEYQADLGKVEFITSLVGFAKAVMKQVSDGYNYYFESKFEYYKLENVLGRLDHDYNICENTNDRVRRHKLNQVTISCKLFYSGGDMVYFVLLAKPGINGSMNHNFFKTLKPKDALLTNQRFTLNQYVLSRRNNQSYNFNKGKEINVPAALGQWSYGLQKKHIESIKSDFLKYLKANDTYHLNQLYNSMAKLIAFGQVRSDYSNLRIFMAKEINIRLKSDKFFKVSTAGNFYNMPQYLQILKGIKIPTITVAEQIKPTILKKMTHPELSRKTMIFNDE